MDSKESSSDPEPLVKASFLDEKRILSKSAAYKAAKMGIIPSYLVGVGRSGVRFRVSEVLAALRRQVQEVGK